jgi:glycosyltransferase involved in cell wall biosynthesis
LTKSILTLCYEYPPLGGGGAKVVSGLTKRLAEKGWDVDVVTMWYRGLPFREKHGGITIYRVPCIRLRQHVCYAPEMLPYIMLAIPLVWYLTVTRRHDVRHTHFLLPDALVSMIVMWLTGAKFIVTAHGSDVPGYNPNRFKLLHRLLAPIWRRVVTSAAEIVTPSENIQNLILSQAADANVVIIPNGIDTSRFCSSRDKEKIVLCVSRLFERKGIQYVIDAAGVLPAPWRIVIAGDGPYLGELRRRAAISRGRIAFTGYLDNKGPELTELYETASIFAFPSSVENFPICLLEAMSAGCAIITTQGTGCAEVVGDSGLLVAPGDISQLETCLVRLIHEPKLRRSLGMAARSRVVSEFGWDSIVERYIQAYEITSRLKSDRYKLIGTIDGTKQSESRSS